MQVIQAPATTDIVRDLPGLTLCYFAAKSTKSTGVSSEFSNETAKTTSADPLPGQISSLQITVRETDPSGGAVAAGDYVKRRNASNTDQYPDAGSDLLLIWDTAVANVGSGITHSAGVFTLGETGHFLVKVSDMFDVDSSTGARVNPQMQMTLAGSVLSPVGFSTQFLRRTNGAEAAILQSMAIINVATTTGDGDELEIRVERVDSDTEGDVNRVAGDRSGISIIKLDDDFGFARYESSAAFSPSGTVHVRTAVDLGTTTEEDSPFTRTGNVIDIATTNLVLVVYSLMNDPADVVTGRSEYQSVIDLQGTEVAGSWGHGYLRVQDGADIVGWSAMALLEPSSGDDLQLMLIGRLQSNEDFFAAIQLVELPSGTEAAIVEATTGNFNAIADFAWDTAPRIDTAAFTHTTGNANVDVDNPGDYLVIGGQAVVSDAGETAGGTRVMPAAQFRVNSTDDESAGHSTYNRNSSTASHPTVNTAGLLTGLSADDSIVVRNDQLNASETGTQNNGSGAMAIIRLSSLFDAGNDPIAAVLPIVSDVVADLKAQGELEAVLPVVFDVAATLAAQGQLDAVLPAVFDVVADLSSTSALDAAMQIEFDVAAEIQGQGSAAGVFPIEFDVAAELVGPAGVAGVLPAEFDVAAALGAAGPLDAALPIEFDVLADLKARGGLEALLELVFAVAADLKARGQLEAANAIVFDLTANLVDASGLSATLDLVFDVAADLKAGGDLDAALGVVFDVAAELRGRGQAESALAIIFNVIADLQAAPSLAATLPIVFNLGAVLTNATPLVQDKMGDPSVRAAKALRERPKPRFYAKQWNQFAETFDAFLRRQESLVRETVLESETVEQAHEAVITSPEFLADLVDVRDVIQERMEISTAATLEAIEPDMLELAKEIRDEEDILAIIALIASDPRVLH